MAGTNITLREIEQIENRIRRMYGMRRYSESKYNTLNKALNGVRNLIALPNVEFTDDVVEVVELFESGLLGDTDAN